MTNLKFFLISLTLALTLVACKSEGGDPEPDTLPFLGIQNASALEGETNGTMVFELRLSAAASKDVAMIYRAENGSAVAGEDYVWQAGESKTLSIPAGQTRATIEILIIGDEVVEGDETFSVVLSEVSNAQLTSDRATGTIRNDDVRDNSTIGDEGYRSPDSYDGFNLIWQDEFNDGQLSNDWRYELGAGGWGNNELQTYTDRAENLYFEEGKLVIEARQDNAGGAAYTSARIVTLGQQAFQYGRIDLRAKLPYGQGIWPALWMLGNNIQDVSWPLCGEIDIMELVGNEPETVHGTVHWANPAGEREQFGGSYNLDDGIFFDEFHVFSIIWEENSIRWLVDDQPYHTIDTSPSNLDEFRNPFFFVFNVAVGGDWPGNPDVSTIFPQKMAVDYVRVFQPQ
jgi:beta-glucanase (GH16 family)